MQVRHENRLIFLFPAFFIVISFSNLACSQIIEPRNLSADPPVINNAEDYKKSISADSTKALVPIQPFIPQIVIDLKYATKKNFTHKVLYHDPIAYARLATVTKLKTINDELNISGIGIKIYDAYRPYKVAKEMWKVVHDERYTANPAKGSGHNRGTSLDLTLVNLSTGHELLMPTAFDNFSEKAHHDYNNLSPEVIANRALLKSTMEKHGFVALSTEWWHYSLPGASDKFELLDLSFLQLKELTTKK